MSEDEQYSLSDGQIIADYRTDPNFMPAVLKEVVALEGRLAGAGDGDEVLVPLESLRIMRAGFLAMIKTQTEAGASFGFDSNHGDQGAHCDYNPFAGINTGDLLPHTL